jgi:hypothetical protein
MQTRIHVGQRSDLSRHSIAGGTTLSWTRQIGASTYMIVITVSDDGDTWWDVIKDPAGEMILIYKVVGREHWRDAPFVVHSVCHTGACPGSLASGHAWRYAESRKRESRYAAVMAQCPKCDWADMIRANARGVWCIPRHRAVSKGAGR